MPFNGPIHSGGSVGLSAAVGIEMNRSPYRPAPAAPFKRSEPGSLASGYRELSKNKTLAGRAAYQNFKGESLKTTHNRLRMVSKLRRKERGWLWRHIFDDLGRTLRSAVVRFNLPMLIRQTGCQIASDAIRYRNI